MVDSIKITALQDIGANIAYTTLVPVVNMAGTPTSQKSNLQNLGNLILNGAGGSYFPRAAQATLALSVANAAQPNITSVGTLTSLAVTGNITAGNISGGNIVVANFYYGDGRFLTNVVANSSYSNSNVAAYLPTYTGNVGAGNISVTGTSNLGAVGNIIITGGSAGQKLTTDGAGNLTWTNDANSNYGNTNVANYLPTFTGTIGANKISSNALSGSNVEINANGARFIFGEGGALYWPAGGNLRVIETNIDNEFEIKSTTNVVISTDISNANSHFTFDSEGIFTSPGNVNLLGSRLNVGPDAATAGNLLNPTLVIANTGAQYIQAAIINNDGAGSSDWSADGAGGGDDEAWTDMGFAGFSFNDANFTITEPGDGYLFVQAYANGLGGNMVLATGDHSNTADIIFATGGFLSNNEFARIDHANDVFHLTRANSGIRFADGTTQTTAATGNIITVNLTGSNTNVLYGNGVFAAVAGGANTGNVTFDDVTVQGDNNSLNLSAGSDFTANLAYLQVRAGDVASHIHLDTGNNDAYDLIVGDDQNYVQVSSTGNILLSSYDSNTAQYIWTLDYNGNLILAGGNSVIQSIANSSLDPTLPNVSTMVFTPDANYNSQILVLDPTAPGHIHLRAYAFSNIDEPAANIFLGGEDTAFEITSGANNEARIHSGGNTWTFGNDGRLTFPGTPRIDTATNNFEVQAAEAISLEANTVVNIYTDAGNNAYQWQFGDDGSLTLPDTTSVIANASITLEANSTGNITGLSVNGDADANLYAHSNVNIVSDGGNREWTFDTTGTLTTPGDITVGGDITGTAGANTLILKAQPNTNTSIQLNSIVDSTIRIDANLEIITDSSNTSQSWNFDIAGNLTLPGNTLAINYANGDAAFGNIVSVNLDGNVSNVLLGNGVFASIPSPTTIANGNSNVSIATANGNVTINAVGNTTMTVTGTGANVTGTLTSTGKIGYASGSTVTQTTNRGTSVTINALAGTIVTTSAAMVATEIDTFAVLNSSVDPNNDIVLAQIVSPNQGTYDCIANPAVIGGFNDGFYINIVNISGFTTSDETITIRFMVFKAPNA